MVEALVNHLWQSSVFAVGIAVLVLLLRNNSASVRYCLWLAASIKFLIPFALLTALGSQLQSSFDVGSELNLNQLAWLPKLEKVIEPVQDSNRTKYYQQPSTKTDAQPTIELPNSGFMSAPRTAVAFNQTLPENIEFAIAKIKSIFLTILFSIGCLGTAIVFGRWVKAWIKLNTIVNQALITQQFDFPVPVKISKDIKVPGVFGVFRQILLLPEKISESLDKKACAAVLAHEKMHLNRYDNATASIHKIVEAIFWFHPFVWWIGKQLNIERELACDEAVLRQGHQPKAYAEGIVSLCQHSVSTPLLCAVGSSGRALRSRIKLIASVSKVKKITRFKKTGLALFASLSLFVPIVLGAFQASNVLAQSKNNKAPKFEHVSLSKGFKEARRVGFYYTPMGGLEVSHWSLLDVIGVAHNVQAV